MHKIAFRQTAALSHTIVTSPRVKGYQGVCFGTVLIGHDTSSAKSRSAANPCPILYRASVRSTYDRQLVLPFHNHLLLFLVLVNLAACDSLLSTHQLWTAHLLIPEIMNGSTIGFRRI